MNYIRRQPSRIPTLALCAACLILGAILGRWQAWQQIDRLTYQVIELQDENIELTYQIEDRRR